MLKYDVFISYRRDGGDALSQLLYTRLTLDGYRVFYDVETMGSGKFNEQILQGIENCGVMIVVLPPNGLDRCMNEGDWVRCELEYGIARKKLMIPVMMKGFEWPEELPPGLDELRNYQGIAAEFNGVFDTWYAKLRSYIDERIKSVHEPADPVNDESDQAYEWGVIALEDGDYERARGIFNEMLRKNVRDARAWLGLAMADEKIWQETDLAKASRPLEQNRNFNRALRYAGPEMKAILQGFADTVRKRAEEDKAEAERKRAEEEKAEAERKRAEEEKAEAERKRQKIIKAEAGRKRTEAMDEAKRVRSEVEKADAERSLFEVQKNKTAAGEPSAVQGNNWQPAGRFDVGNHVMFGRYPQTAQGTYATPVEWLVLDRKDGRVLLISRYGLDCKKYHSKWKGVTWETCELRSWLNNTFLRTAFSEAERSAIEVTEVDNGKEQGYGKWSGDGGSGTCDMVFLLSYAEANRYFNVTEDNVNNMDSRAAPTEYASAKGASGSIINETADGAKAGWWWLRSPGIFQTGAAVVGSDGSLRDHSARRSGCVRPALWVSLKAGFFRNV